VAALADRVLAMTILQNCRRLRSMVVALALFSPCAAQAQSPGEARKDQGVCDTVAKTILVVEPPGGSRGPWQAPLFALSKASPGVVSIDKEGWRGKGKEDALDKWRREYRAEPSLVEALGKLAGDDWTFPLYRFGRSSLHMAKIIEGSASCQGFLFFDAPPTAAAHPIAAPPVVQTAEPFAFCYRTTAYAGEIVGVPAFIVETDQDSTVELSFTPWRDGGWQRECRVTIRFRDVFEVTDRFCKGVDCQEMANQALSLVKKVDQRPQAAQEDASGGGEKFQAMKELADNEPGSIQSFPTFGSSIRGLDSAEFALDPVVLPIVVGGETYLARLGHSAVGWRTYPDYLLAAYKMVGNSLEPVAGLLITMTRGKPISATVN
jgi:hypothetical protein